MLVTEVIETRVSFTDIAQSKLLAHWRFSSETKVSKTSSCITLVRDVIKDAVLLRVKVLTLLLNTGFLANG